MSQELASRIKRDPLVITQSDLGAFTACRRAWFFGTYLGLREREPKAFGPLTLGTRVHAALEGYYGDGRDLLEVYAELVAEERSVLEASGVVFGRDEWESEAELGRIMLEGYYEWLEETGADADWEVIGAEQRLSALLMDGQVELRGKVDLRVKLRSSGARLVVDSKTCAHFSNVTTLAPYAPQLPTYMLLERIVYPDSQDEWLQGAVYNMLRKVKRSVNSKPPYYDRMTVMHNDTYMRNFWTRINGLIKDYVSTVKALDEGVDHHYVAYPIAGSQCRYCPFKFVCLASDDGSRVDDMINDLYVQRDPHERYEEEPANLIPDSATR